MKRIIVFLLLAALLLGGCGTRTPEAETSETPNASAAAPNMEIRDWSEPSAVDDSYSFQHDPTAYYEETGDDSGLYGLITKNFLPEYVDRWVDGGGDFADGVSWPEQRRKPERRLLRLDRLYRYAENRARLAHGGLQRD